MALFRCYQENIHRTFVIELTDAAKVKQARSFVRGEQPSKSVKGTIVKEPKPYNAPWSWHIDPNSIEFFDKAAEVCDSSILQVEEHLDEVGGAFLPHNVWCPWQSRVIEEVELDMPGLRTLK